MSAVALYELADARDILDQWLSESEGELTPEIETLLNELEGAIDEKVERVALYIIEQLSHAKALKAEEERLAQRRKAREKAAASLKDYLAQQMDRFGKQKVDGKLCTVAFQKNPPSVTPIIESDEADFRNVFMIAPEFVTRVPESYSWNKRAILDAAKAGPLPEDIAKRVSITQSVSLRIR